MIKKYHILINKVNVKRSEKELLLQVFVLFTLFGLSIQRSISFETE